VDRLLQNEIFVRFLALALAVLIYLQVVAQPANGNVQRTIVGVPIRMVSLPSDVAVAATHPTTVAITVSGSAKVVNSLNPGSVVASVDMAAARLGTAAYYVQVSVPPGVQPLEATPADVNVTVEAVIERETAVQVQVTGTAAKGFGPSGAATSSSRIVVLRGAADAVNQVVRTVASVDITGADATVSQQVSPVAEAQNGQAVPGVQVVPSTVGVTVPIGPLTSGRTVAVVPDVTGQPAPGYTLVGTQVVPAQVDLLGPPSDLSSLAHVTTQAVSIQGDKASVTVQALVVEPAGVTAVTPSDVQVQVQIAKATG
jgi:YbbR domain-containing protein